jgi:tetratricopeptide (TPR) repeat protein
LVRALLVLLALVLATPARGGIAAAQPQASIQPASPKPGEGGPKTRKLSPAELSAVERRLSEAVRRDPGSFQAHHALAGFYLQQGKLDAAIPHLEEARTIDPAHYANGYDLALALLETGKLDRAREQIQRMLSVKETAELHNLLGDVDERGGNLARAAAEYQRAAHMDPTEEHLFDWGNNLVQLRAFEPATEVFSAAIKRHPKSGRLYVGLGIAQYSRGQYEDAVNSFCQATDLAPSDPRPYLFLGDMYGVVPELGGEIARRLARFVKAQPRNALAHFHYAMTLWKGQPADSPAADMRRVEALLRRAVALDPKLTKGFLELGILLSDQQRYKEAIQELRSAVRLEPGLAQAHYRLAQAYNRTGQGELAVKELELFEQLKGGSR